MFQLIFMQFNVMTDTNLSQGEVAKIAINGESGDYQRYPLIGGGSVLVADRVENTKKFIDFGQYHAFGGIIFPLYPTETAHLCQKSPLLGQHFPSL